MRFPFIWRKTAEANEQVWKDEAGRRLRRAERAERERDTERFGRQRLNGMYVALFDEYEQAFGPLAEAPAGEPPVAGFDPERARRAADRIAALRDGCERAQAELAAEKRRADGLQKQLDDALGLNTAAVAAGETWQDRREKRMQFDKPVTAEGAAS
ncbi:MAG: hypothetical protein HOY76_14600 [Streptomyces sp.]|nr:hypothetical protein [Streptomyces sp.]